MKRLNLSFPPYTFIAKLISNIAAKMSFVARWIPVSGLEYNISCTE